MNVLTNLLEKIAIFLSYKEADYLAREHRKFVSHWGVGSYGRPNISCFDYSSRLSVGSYTSIAPNTSILLAANHRRDFITTFPQSHLNKNVTPFDSTERGDVVIGNDVWIGYGATIVGPVTIGDGAIIGAGAVVVRDIPPYAVAVGVPAKVVKFRFSDEQINVLKKIQWWKWSSEKIRESESLLFSNNIQEFINKFSS